jgi:hypothetical protein
VCMNRKPRLFWFLVPALAALAACSSDQAAKDAKKAAPPPHQIQGKIQIVEEATSSNDAALNAGGPSIFIRDGVRRYRLFLKSPVDVTPDTEYIAEGVHAQKAIDEIGDPANGAKGYPLEASCQRVIRTAWGGQSFELADSQASLLRRLVNRYPARPIFLVTRLTPAPAKEGAAKSQADEEKELPSISVPMDKQKALLIAGPAVQPAPLWSPAGGTARCKVVIDEKGKISDLDTGAQLCEAVPWSEFSYQPPAQKGRPVTVKTEVEVRFEPRKT